MAQPDIEIADTSAERLVPIEDVNTRRELWHGVWDWLIRECERLASESETMPPDGPR